MEDLSIYRSRIGMFAYVAGKTSKSKNHKNSIQTPNTKCNKQSSKKYVEARVNRRKEKQSICYPRLLFYIVCISVCWFDIYGPTYYVSSRPINRCDLTGWKSGILASYNFYSFCFNDFESHTYFSLDITESQYRITNGVLLSAMFTAGYFKPLFDQGNIICRTFICPTIIETLQNTSTLIRRTCSYLIGNKGSHITNGNPRRNETEDPGEAAFTKDTLTLIKENVDRSVGFISVGRVRGTGFRVGNDLFMTAYHVLNTPIEYMVEKIVQDIDVTSEERLKEYLLQLEVRTHILSTESTEKELERITNLFIKESATNIPLLLQRSSGFIDSEELTQQFTKKWLTTCKVDFIEHGQFSVDWKILFGDKDRDIVIVKLLETQPGQAYPRPLLLDENYRQHGDIHVVRYIHGEHPKFVMDQGTLVLENNENAQMVVDEAIQWWHSNFPKTDVSFFRNQYAECCNAVNEETGRVILRASESFIPGSSGSPIIYLFNNTGQPVVCMIYQKGYPEFYYEAQDSPKTELLQYKNVKVDNKCFLEGGTTMKKLAELFIKHGKLDLKDEIFTQPLKYKTSVNDNNRDVNTATTHELRSDISSATNELRSNVASATDEIKQNMAAASDDFKEKIAFATVDLRQEMASVTEKLRQDMAAATDDFKQEIMDAASDLKKDLVCTTAVVRNNMTAATEDVRKEVVSVKDYIKDEIKTAKTELWTNIATITDDLREDINNNIHELKITSSSKTVSGSNFDARKHKSASTDDFESDSNAITGMPRRNENMDKDQREQNIINTTNGFNDNTVSTKKIKHDINRDAVNPISTLTASTGSMNVSINYHHHKPENRGEQIQVQKETMEFDDIMAILAAREPSIHKVCPGGWTFVWCSQPDEDESVITDTSMGDKNGRIEIIYDRENPASTSGLNQFISENIYDQENLVLNSGVNQWISGTKEIENIRGTADLERRNSKPPSDDMVLYVEKWKEEDKWCYVSKGVEETVQNISSDDYHYIAVVGSSGSGKSTTIRHAALHLKETLGYTVYPITSPEEFISYLDKDSQQAFVIDDAIGENYVDKELLNSWDKYNDRIKSCLQVNKTTKFLTALRVQLFSDPLLKGKTYIFNDKTHNINLNSTAFKLTLIDMQNMLRHYLQAYAIGNVEGIIKQIWPETYNNTGEQFADCFPLLCRVFCESRLVRQDPHNFFVSPFPALTDIFLQMKNRNKYQFCGLLLCAVTDLKDKYFSPFCESNPNQEIFNSLIKSQDMDPEKDLLKIKDALKTLDGVYISHIGNTYTYSHSIFQNIVTFIHDDQYFVFKYATRDFIRTRVRLFSKLPTDDDYVIVLYDEECIDFYVNRMIYEYEHHDVLGLQFILENVYIDNDWLLSRLEIKMFDNDSGLSQEKIERMFSMCMYGILEAEEHEDDTLYPCYKLIKMLIPRVDCNRMVFDRYFPIHISVGKGLVSLTKHMIDHNTDVNVVDRLKRSVLHYALDTKNSFEMTRYLLSLPNLSCLNQADEYDKSPYWYLLHNKWPDWQGEFFYHVSPQRQELMALYEEKDGLVIYFNAYF